MDEQTARQMARICRANGRARDAEAFADADAFFTVAEWFEERADELAAFALEAKLSKLKP